MTLDIVVVNYKTAHDLDQFLESLDQHEPNTETTLAIIEVETELDTEPYPWGSGSRPGTRLGATANIGYARACNLGASLGQAEIIALFNADIVLASGALDTCHDALTGHETWSVLGPRQVDDSGRIRHAGIFGTDTQPTHRGWNERDIGQYTDTTDAITVSGSAYFIKRTAWDELTNCPLFRDVAPDAQGAFLPTQHYFEETFASAHARAHGHRVIYFGETTIIHKWHRASPVGGWAEQQYGTSQAFFRAACDHHGIAHD
jgi:GT2 family glycosyltransferase